MSEWRWIDRRALLLLHDESIAEHGGASGIRDEGLLDSALARPLKAARGGPASVKAIPWIMRRIPARKAAASHIGQGRDEE
mgnify:CR=1 FL=1